MIFLLLGSALIAALIGYCVADCRGLRQRIDLLEAQAERLEEWL